MWKPLVVALCGLSSCLLLALAGCAKQDLQIGREDPDVEIQKCVRLSQKKHFEKAVECLEIFKSRFPQTPQGQEAELKIADNHFQQRQYLLAADTYQTFVKLHPQHPQVDYALFRTGLSYLKEAPKAIDRDQQYLFKALDQLELALRVSPQSTYRPAILEELKNVQRRIARRLYYIGRFYFKTGEYIAAIPRFKELADQYPQSDLAPRSLYYKTRAHIALGQMKSARESVEQLMQHFSNDPWTNRARERYFGALKEKG